MQCIVPDNSGVANKSFDFVIIGGGTAGLTLATRLTEDPNISVAVLEAGEPNLFKDEIRVPAQYGRTFGNPQFDWAFQTEPQEHAYGKVYAWNRGKGLGGSSALNFYVWVKPPAQDFDAIQKLGNDTWNWEEFAKYTKKSETFHEPTQEQHKRFKRSEKEGYTFNHDYRGSDGPIQTCIPFHTTLDTPWQETMVNLGAKYIDDPYGGDITGTWICHGNLDPKDHTRSYSVTGYLNQARDRPNLTVLTEALVHKIVTEKDSNGMLTATGVEFSHDGKTHVVHAKKEVISSAGALKTPQVLELSGIGNQKILESFGIDVKVDLPGVGENLQEHMFIAMVWALKEEWKDDTFDVMRKPEVAAKHYDLHKSGSNESFHCLGIASFAYLPYKFAFDNGEEKELIKKEVERLEKAKETIKATRPGLWEQYEVMIDSLKDEAVPDLELAVFPGFYGTASAPQGEQKYISALGVLNHPWSRGEVHIKSTNPQQDPKMDPHYFEDDFDMVNMTSHLKLFRRISKVEPFKSMIKEEVAPGANMQEDEELRKYVAEHMTTAWHSVGTTSMLPREQNGVVDSKLKVYGTNNIRVVDVGVIPLHLATHTHSVAYVVGEKAADIIKASL